MGNRKSFCFRALLVIAAAFIMASCGNKTPKSVSIDGKYVFEDNISMSVITISGDRWTMRTKFGAPGYRYGTDDKFDAGEMKGNILYHSGLIPYGRVSNGTVTIGFRQYTKQ